MIRNDIEPAWFQNIYNLPINFPERERGTDFKFWVEEGCSRTYYIHKIVEYTKNFLSVPENLLKFKEQHIIELNECDVLDKSDEDLIKILLDNICIYDGSTSYDEHSLYCIAVSLRHPTYPNGEAENKARHKAYEPIKKLKVLQNNMESCSQNIEYHTKELSNYMTRLEKYKKDFDNL